MIKKLLIYTTLLLSLTACSVEDIEAPSGLGPDGELTVELAVPEMEVVKTRASETAITDITMLVLSSTGVEDVQSFPFSSLSELSTDHYQLRCKLGQELRLKSGLRFYFIANLPSSVNSNDFKGKAEATLKSMQMSAITNTAGNMTMSGALNLNEILGGTPVSLSRNAAKVTVNNGTKNAAGNWTAGSTVYPVEVYGTAASSSVVSGALIGTDYVGNAVAPASISFTGKSVAYIQPTKNPGRDNQVRPYMIVKAPYDGTDYFYRLEFENYDETTKKFNTLDILSNHHYQVLIEEVLGKGDTTAEAALKNPTSLIKATIYDFSPQSYNMITDGTRELGVSARLLHNGEVTTADNPEYIFIKVYSKEASDMTNAAAAINLKADVEWLSFGAPEVYNDALGDKFPDVSDDFKGIVYRVPVNFSKTLDPGELDGTITVTWKGLSRDIPVIWTRVFDASELCTVHLTITDNTGNKKFDTRTGGTDYWTFIRDTSKIDGLSVEQNNGKVRNEGLHFPVNYGGQSARWKYTYDLSFHNLNDGNPYDWRITSTGVSGLTFSRTSGTNVTGTADLTITHDGSIANWNYEVGNLRFEIRKPGEDHWTEYDLDLYHTGFFDNPTFRSKVKYTEDRRVDQPEKDFFYYYEVIQGPAGKYYWLDRNLGATSAEYYIEGEGDFLYHGRTSEPRGGYYRAAHYVKGESPEMYEDLCPPGFEIPRVEVWNTLRNSTNFLMSRNGEYYLTQFVNAQGQIVYFPRSRYYDASNSKNGESRAGYYWSQTPSDGMEKDQIGNWLRYLKFSGSIAAYDNAEVYGRFDSNGWAMSVRCVNIDKPANVVWRTHFNVSGATHVFLYSLDEDGVTKNGVTNWPGKAIGNYVTMGDATGMSSGTNLFNFAYESANTHPSQFYVLFTFRDKDGKWHTMSKGNNGETIYSDDKGLSQLQGWKVIGDTWSGEETTLGGTWHCNFDGTTATVTYEKATEDIPIIEPLPEDITIYYTNPNNWGTVYVYAYNSDQDRNNAWPGVMMTKGADGRWSATIKSRFNNLIFTNYDGAQTQDLTVEKENNHVYTDR